MAEHEDSHFLIDSAPPVEVEYCLRALSFYEALPCDDLRERILAEWQYETQRNFSLSVRRVLDLGIATKCTVAGGKPGYRLSSLGAKVRSILEADHELYADVMHFLHYDGDDGSPNARKLFWSYKRCCDILWQTKQLPPVTQMVAEVQSDIARLFPEAYRRRVGGNFNAGGVTSGWKPWLAALASPPIAAGHRELQLRTRRNFELVLLALDHVYRSRTYRYGDPVVLDDDVLDELTRVFFLDPVCSLELLRLADRVTRAVVLRGTFAGTSVNLLSHYGVENM